MAEDDGVYRKLQRHIDRMPIGMPTTSSGVELRILQRLFTPEEAEVALSLNALPETLGTIHRRDRKSGRTRDVLERVLDRLAERGAIVCTGNHSGRDARKRYGKAMLVLGMYEMQVDRLTKELQADFEQYLEEGFARALLPGRTNQMRTIPVNARFVPERRVGRYDDARQLIQESRGPFALMNCVCRQGKDLLGEPCRQTDERRVCMALTGIARSTIATGVGAEITRDEALARLDRAERDGMVLQPSNTQAPLFMCFCCGCCCGMLKAARQFPRPADYLRSHFSAAIDASLCSDCQSCRSRCPMQALDGQDGVTVVDLDRCIGCGLCVSACPSGAARLVAKSTPGVPPKGRQALYLRILRERYGVVGAARFVGRALLRRQV